MPWCLFKHRDNSTLSAQTHLGQQYIGTSSHPTPIIIIIIIIIIIKIILLLLPVTCSSFLSPALHAGKGGVVMNYSGYYMYHQL
jgi:hypothetical protein